MFIRKDYEDFFNRLYDIEDDSQKIISDILSIINGKPAKEKLELMLANKSKHKKIIEEILQFIKANGQK